MDTTPLNPGNAHSVFQIPELSQLIVQHSDKRTIHSLVCTCHSFFDLFMPLLWGSVRGIAQLLALFPRAKIVEHEGSKDEGGTKQTSLTFPSSLSPSDFARFLLYTPHVKHLEIFQSEKDEDHAINEWEKLVLLSGDIQLLPNLRSLTLTKRSSPSRQTHFETPWLASFIHPPLQVLRTIMLDGQNPPTISFPGGSFLLRTLGSTCLDLRSLEIYPTRGQELSLRDQQILAQLEEAEEGPECFRPLSGLTALRSLATTVSALQQTGLDILSHLPQLEHLELVLLDEDFNGTRSALVLPTNGFPHMRHLGLYRQPNLQFFHYVWGLDALVAKLTSVRLRFDRYHWPQLMDYEMFSGLVTILAEKSPCIINLELHPPFEGSSAEMSTAMFTLLSQLPLETLCFSPVVPSLLRVGHQPSTYPLLRKLELFKSSIEPPDLRHLAESLPSLEYLAVNLSIPPERLDDGDRGNTALLQSIILWVKSVYLQEEPSDRTARESEIETFLFSLWPNVRFVRSPQDAPKRAYNALWIPPILSQE